MIRFLNLASQRLDTFYTGRPRLTVVLMALLAFAVLWIVNEPSLFPGVAR